jgi:FtsH-binding integral membrane protein
MSSNAVPLGPPMTRDAAGTLLGQTMGLVAVTAALFAVGAYLGRNLAYQWGWLLFIAASACLIAMNLAAQRSQGLTLTLTLLFGFGPLIRSGGGADTQLLHQRRSAGGLAGGRSNGAVHRRVRSLRRSQDIRTAPLLAASIFLDILNVFLLFLPIFGGRED